MVDASGNVLAISAFAFVAGSFIGHCRYVFAGLLFGANYFASLFYSTSGFEDRRKGMASGLHESSLAMGCGAGGLLGGILGTWLGSRVPYYFCALVLGLSATAQMTIYLFMRRRWLQK